MQIRKSSSDPTKITVYHVQKYKRALSSIGSMDDTEPNKIFTVTVDNGVNEHAVNQLSYFEEVQEIEAIQLTMANGSKIQVTQKGKALVKISN